MLGDVQDICEKFAFAFVFGAPTALNLMLSILAFLRQNIYYIGAQLGRCVFDHVELVRCQAAFLSLDLVLALFDHDERIVWGTSSFKGLGYLQFLFQLASFCCNLVA